MRRLLSWGLCAGTLALSTIVACVYRGESIDLRGQDVHVTFLHTADWHSRLFPYHFDVGQVDQNLGLSAANAPFGGAARAAHILQRERTRAGRVLHVDSGDCFQGAPVFNFFRGEAEVRSLAASGCDVAVVGNHEFDKGAANYAHQVQEWATFPVLAANYLFEDPTIPGNSVLGNVAQPYTVFNLRGLRVGVIGVGNLSALASIFDTRNRQGITPLSTREIVQFYVDLLRPTVDLIVVVSHLGLFEDEELIQGTSGIDIVFGGHLHIVLAPPKELQDCSCDPVADTWCVRSSRVCTPRNVLLVHSGAFLKYIGRLDVIVRQSTTDPTDWEVVSHGYQLFPVDSTIPDDPSVAEILEPYGRALDQLTDLDLLAGFAPQKIPRFSTGGAYSLAGSSEAPTPGGDSALGNVVASAMWVRPGIQTDFSLTNTTGLRADIPPGPVTIEQMYNVFPFDNTVSTMFLSGVEVQELFDFVARRSSERACQSQAQIAGARIELNCARCNLADPNLVFVRTGEQVATEPCAEKIYIGQDPADTACTGDADCPPGYDCLGGTPANPAVACWRRIDRNSSYSLATSNYLAGGGSGYLVLQRNTTQVDTGLPQRDATIDYMRNGLPCGIEPGSRRCPCAEPPCPQNACPQELPACMLDSDCLTDEICACPQNADGDAGTQTCTTTGMCASGGRCVLAACRDGTAQFLGRFCGDAFTQQDQHACFQHACASAGEDCKLLACVNRGIGAFEDGRTQMVSQ